MLTEHEITTLHLEATDACQKTCALNEDRVNQFDNQWVTEIQLR